MNYLLYPHGGSGNHGCEAIVRTTAKMLQSPDVFLYSDHVDEDIQYLDTDSIKLLNPTKYLSRCSIEYLGVFIRAHFFHREDAFDAAAYYPILSRCNNNATLLSIGGDNYCYGDNEFIYMVNRYARKKNAHTILWGCSVEPGGISERMREDIRKYDLIIARESITYETLSKISDNVLCFPDPAFTLPMEKYELDEKMISETVIGINISPMIQSNESISGITMRNYEYLIDRILMNTSCNIALIPHVVWRHNDDRIPLRKLYEKYKDTNRVFLVEDNNCMRLKYVISKCSVFIGARTHATIAAYSSCVPTLVVGYSVKARGIAKDLFGTYDKYVLPVQELKEENDLWNDFQWIWNNKESIQKHLLEIMPNYIERAREAGRVVIERF